MQTKAEKRLSEEYINSALRCNLLIRESSQIQVSFFVDVKKTEQHFLFSYNLSLDNFVRVGV